MFLVGLTGGIATGKSTVSDIFKSKGIPVIDADVIARNVVKPGRKAWYKLKIAFGDEIFNEDGTLNREALAELIFDSAERRRTLNEITHPEIIKEIKHQIVKYFFFGYRFVVLDLPLLFETGYMLDFVYKIIVVTCEEDLQLQRVMERHKLSESKAKLRIAAQMPLELKCEKADYVVENSAGFDDTREQVIRIIQDLQASKHYLKFRILFSLLSTGVLTLVVWLGYKLSRLR